MAQEPTVLSELDELAAEVEEQSGRKELSFDENPLEDLFADAQSQREERKLRRPRNSLDASLREALDAAAKKMREVYSDPANWKRIRGVALIDKASQTALGNYSEYINWKVEMQPGVSPPKKWVREAQPIVVEAVLEVEGFLGVEKEKSLRNLSWDSEVEVTCHVALDQLFCEAPAVRLKVCLQLSSIIRVELVSATQFANSAGAVLLNIPAGVDIWPAVTLDTRALVRRGL